MEANRLLFILAMVLPAGLNRTICHAAAMRGDPEAIMEALIAVRVCIQSLGSLGIDDGIVHKPPMPDLRQLN